MSGYIPQSNDFMYQDPEQVDEYTEWQKFAKYLLIDEELKRARLKTNYINSNYTLSVTIIQ